MTWKHNNDNDLQVWKIEHLAVTCGMFIADKVLKSTAVARFKLHRGLTVKCSVLGNITYRQTVNSETPSLKTIITYLNKKYYCFYNYPNI
jgi:hypothetical protein